MEATRTISTWTMPKLVDVRSRGIVLLFSEPLVGYFYVNAIGLVMDQIRHSYKLNNKNPGLQNTCTCIIHLLNLAEIHIVKHLNVAPFEDQWKLYKLNESKIGGVANVFVIVQIFFVLSLRISTLRLAGQSSYCRMPSSRKASRRTNPPRCGDVPSFLSEI